MKMILTLAAVLLVPVFAHAQAAPATVTTSAPGTARDVNGFTAKNYPGYTTEQADRPPNPNVVLKPKTGGILVDGAKYGPEIISPTAPASWGIGEKYMSAPAPDEDVKHVAGYAAHRDSGGFKLFSFDF